MVKRLQVLLKLVTVHTDVKVFNLNNSEWDPGSTSVCRSLGKLLALHDNNKM